MSHQDKIIIHLKNYGFFLPSAEIYGRLANSWDCGPTGTELKKNLKNLWWKYFITGSPHNVGCDSSLLTHPEVLKASGHLQNFHDWMVECSNCHQRYRLDHLLSPEEFAAFSQSEQLKNQFLEKKCSNCRQRKFVSPRQFNLLLSTNLGSTEESGSKAYFRPETCQGIFTNFSAIQLSSRRQLPFGIGQIGKSFRNEITLHHGVFRTREFEQMELEFFCSPDDSEKQWNYWVTQAEKFLQKVVINNPSRIKSVELKPDELPHYARKTTDLYFQYHFGWGELCSNSHRGNYDLAQHSQHSKKDLSIKGVIPEVIEVSFGVERLMLAILEDAYQMETIKNARGENSEREVLKLPPLLAPYFATIIPGPANKEEGGSETRAKIRKKARELYCELLPQINFSLAYEETDSIGKSYRRQDAIGTYYCLTVDVKTINKYSPDGKPNSNYNTVTLRHRDTMEQEKDRINIEDIKNYLYSQYEKYFAQFFQK